MTALLTSRGAPAPGRSAPRTTDVTAAVRPDGRVVWHAPAGAYAAIPVWAGATAWLEQLEQHPELAAACRRRRVALDRVLGGAEVAAQAADSRTGRHVTLALAQIGEALGCSLDVARRVWRVLQDVGLAQLVRLGARMTAAQRYDALTLGRGGMRLLANEWALTSPPVAVQAVSTAHRRRVRATPPVGWLRNLFRRCSDKNSVPEPASPTRPNQDQNPPARGNHPKAKVGDLVDTLHREFDGRLTRCGYRRSASAVARLAERGVTGEALVDAIKRWCRAEGFEIQQARTPGYLASVVRAVEYAYLAGCNQPLASDPNGGSVAGELCEHGVIDGSRPRPTTGTPACPFCRRAHLSAA